MFIILLTFPLPSRDMAEIPIKRRKYSIQPTNQPTNQPTASYFYGYKEQFPHHPLPIQLRVV